LLQIGFAAFGALTGGDQLLALTAWTLLGNTPLMIAVVTDEATAGSVHCESRIALIAICGPAALMAE
jgi:hypothetical protein